MKFFRYVVSAFSIFISSYSSAYVVTDVREFNQIYPPNFERPEMEPDWIYDITDYGFVRGRDTVSPWMKLTLEIRDPDWHPGEDWPEHPFITLHVSGARYHGYATDTDWVKNIGGFHEEDILPIAITIYDLPGIWLGKVTLTLEITPGTTAVTESAPFSLITIGCLALAFARYRNS